VVGTLVGFAIFLVLLLFAVQVVVRLYAESALTSAATRAAETVASSPNTAFDAGVAESAAESEARDQLGSFGSRHTSFVWRQADADQVVLEVSSRSPEFLPGLPGWSRIQRTVTVRTERFR
jgi:hypothetical protein